MKKLRDYFIGDILAGTGDAFERARGILLWRLCAMFTIIFLLPIAGDLALGFGKAVVVHTTGYCLLLTMPFMMKKQHNIERSINWFFAICTCISLCTYMVLNPTNLDKIGIAWSTFFLVLSALMQRGITRIIYCCFLVWVPIIYVTLNTLLHGALTIEPIVQQGAENPPSFLILIPIVLSIYTVWTSTLTIEDAKRTIVEQKQIIDEKNKDIIDSIHYARRIQNSLLPTEKYLQRNLERLNKSEGTKSE